MRDFKQMVHDAMLEMQTFAASREVNGDCQCAHPVLGEPSPTWSGAFCHGCGKFYPDYRRVVELHD